MYDDWEDYRCTKCGCHSETCTCGEFDEQEESE